MTTNYQSGHDAEKEAAQYLQSIGFKVIDLNWRTAKCEIDIVARKNKVVWLIEVKSRKNSNQGYGYEYVTSKKLQKMHYAAEMWVAAHSWRGDYRLAVISIDGETLQFIDDL